MEEGVWRTCLNKELEKGEPSEVGQKSSRSLLFLLTAYSNFQTGTSIYVGTQARVNAPHETLIPAWILLYGMDMIIMKRAYVSKVHEIELPIS